MQKIIEKNQKTKLVKVIFDKKLHRCRTCTVHWYSSGGVSVYPA